MARMSIDTLSYFGAQTALGSRDSKRIGHNTTLHRTYGGAYAVQYHSTDILTAHPDGSIEIATGGWDTITTKTRINHLLPGGYGIHGHRIAGQTSLYLWVRGYPITPFVDGLTVQPADGSVGYQGDVILTAADISAMIAAADERRATLDAKREVRRAADHAAKPDAPSSAFRHAYGCAECRALQEAEYDAALAAMHKAHARGEHVREHIDVSWPIDPATGRTDYRAPAIHAAPVMVPSCPWQCPDRIDNR